MGMNMGLKSLYNQVIKYEITAKCKEPLHVGSGSGLRGEVLIHPIQRQPFLPATGIAGAFRDYFSDDKGLQNALFGGQEDEDVVASRIKFTDGFFNQASVYTELRPRVRIDRKTGTCQSNSVNGGTASSGQKFEMEVISADSTFGFSVYLYQYDEENYQKEIERSLTALHKGNIQLGGQKSNGCGYVSLESVKRSVYNLWEEEDRKDWIDEGKTSEDIINELIEMDENATIKTCFVLSGNTEGSILVKSVSVSDYDEDAPDAENIRNHKKEYIIPASSIKGVVRSRIEKICKLKAINPEIIDDIFGRCSDKDKEGKLGCVRFYDCVIGDAEENDKVVPQKRIHIDKFTGSVMYQGLFSEKPAGGKVTIRVDVLNSGTNQAKALILLALRDIGIGVTPLGSESSIGRGFIHGKTLAITEGVQQPANIEFESGKISDAEHIVERYLSAL